MVDATPTSPEGQAKNGRRYDVFLSHNSRDKPAAARIAAKLRRAGLEPWLDEEQLTGGDVFPDELAAALAASRACAVHVGPHGPSDWLREEAALALRRAAHDRAFRTFLVYLPGLHDPYEPSDLLAFLGTRTRVDLRDGCERPDQFDRLVRAVNGIAPTAKVEPPAEDACPYRGLEAFDEADAAHDPQTDVVHRRGPQPYRHCRVYLSERASFLVGGASCRASPLPKPRRAPTSANRRPTKPT